MGLIQVAIQHVCSYLGLISGAAAEYRAALLRRILYAAAALVMAVATLVSAWITGLALLWNTPWRTTYCLISVLLCLIAATVFTVLAVRRTEPGPFARSLRREAAQDLAMLEEWRRAQ